MTDPETGTLRAQAWAFCNATLRVAHRCLHNSVNRSNHARAAVTPPMRRHIPPPRLPRRRHEADVLGTGRLAGVGYRRVA